MPLRIPEGQRTGLEKLLGLSKENLEVVADGIKGSPPTLFIRDLAGSVAPAIGVAPSSFEEAIRVLSSLYLARLRSRMEVGKFIEGVRSAIEREGMGPPSSGWEAFERFLSTVLALDQSLGVTSKALDILTRYDHTYCDARFTTDLRPIFGLSASSRPAALTVVHTFELDYHVPGVDGVKHFHVAMDKSDLIGLRGSIDRALEKDAASRQLGKELNIPCLEVEE